MSVLADSLRARGLGEIRLDVLRFNTSIFLRQQPSTVDIHLRQDDDRALHNPESSEKELIIFVQVYLLKMGTIL